MGWLALVLIGFAVADLVHSVRAVRVVPECVGAAVVVVVGLLAGFSSPGEAVGLAVVAAATVAWGQSVTRGFARGGRAWVPLTLLVVAVVVALAASTTDGFGGGLVGRWLDDTPLGLFRDLRTDRFLLLVGVTLFQMSSGNVVVRLVLAATDTVNPARDDHPEQELKGGRLLGPMERLFILGLGLAGSLTAASLVIAAKGLLRFPELRSDAGQEHLHRLTEYFLVGSFVSWLVALVGLLLGRV